MPSVTPSRMVGMAKLCLKLLPRARARAMEKLSVPFNLCTDLRGPSKTSWSRKLELHWNPKVRCWLGWSSTVPTFSYFFTKGSRTMVTLPTCVEGQALGCVDYRKRGRHKLEPRWSRSVFVGVRIKTTERIVMDETGTHVVQSVRRVPEEQRYDHRLLQSVRGTPWEPNPGDVSTDLPKPMLFTPQLPDVEPAPTQTYHSDNRGPRNVYIRKVELGRFGCTAGCPACEVHRARSPMSGQEHTAECRKRLEDVMETDASTSTRVEGVANPRSSRGSG